MRQTINGAQLRKMIISAAASKAASAAYEEVKDHSGFGEFKDAIKKANDHIEEANGVIESRNKKIASIKDKADGAGDSLDDKISKAKKALDEAKYLKASGAWVIS